MEILLVEMPNPNANDLAYKVAGTEEDPNPLKNETLAASLREAMEQTGVEDPQAKLLIELYQDGVVTNASRPALDGLCNALEPADELSHAVYSQNPNTEESPLEKALSDARRSIDFDNVFFTDHNGLVGLPDESGKFIIRPTKITPNIFEESDPVTKKAREANLSHWTEQVDLRWTRDDEGNQTPTRLSSFYHTALGRLSSEGVFELAITVLDENHPARRP